MKRIAVLLAAACAAGATVAVANGHDSHHGAPISPVETLFEQTTRATQWQLVDRVKLQFDAHHPEGLAKVGNRYFLSTVEVLEPTVRCPTTCDGTDRSPGKGRGWLIEFDAQGHKLREVRVDDGDRIYHAGGLDYDGQRLWTAVAEYRPNKPSMIVTASPYSLKPKVEFKVPDHIGGIVHDTARGRVVGLNWGSRTAYEWSRKGHELRTDLNPSHYVDYQDCKFVSGGWDGSRMFCGGIAGIATPSGAGLELGGLGLVQIPGMRPLHEIPFQQYTPQNHVATRNAIDVETNGNRLRVSLVADDDDSELLVYETG